LSINSSAVGIVFAKKVIQKQKKHVNYYQTKLSVYTKDGEIPN